MSLARGTVAVLVLLLPGFVFLATVYLPGRYAREAGPLNPAGQAAIAVLVSALVHGALLLGLRRADGRGLVRSPDMEVVLALLQVSPPGTVTLRAMGTSLADAVPSLLAYLCVGCVMGGLLGLGWGWLFVSTPMRAFAQHGWVAGLVRRKRAWTLAHVMSRVALEGRVILYRGRLADFALLASGRFAYVVLTEPIRSYLDFEFGPHSTAPDHRLEGGGYGVGGEELLESHLVIEGDDIQNVVFERYEVVLSSRGEARLNHELGRLSGVPVHRPASARGRRWSYRVRLPWRPDRYVAVELGEEPAD